MNYSLESAMAAAENRFEAGVVHALGERWQTCIDRLDYAFQPIVSVHTGVAIGHEALLRNVEQAGFASIQEVFDSAYQEKVLFRVELALREKAIGKYARLGFGDKGKLFFNANRSIGKRLKDFTVKCPVSEISNQAEKILGLFTLIEDSEGIIITENGKYLGFLTAKSLLRILNEKNLTLARDQNPLTKLPGNNLINQYLSKIVSNDENYYYAVYLDFDNFKPFNDRYGFRTGDRAIIMFTEMLNRHLFESDVFIGHIGGDDFFVGFEKRIDETEYVTAKISRLIETFSNDVTSLYDVEDRERGYIVSRDREGVIKEFPMMAVSAAILRIPPGERRFSVEMISGRIAYLKKMAKKSPDHIVAADIYF